MPLGYLGPDGGNDIRGHDNFTSNRGRIVIHGVEKVVVSLPGMGKHGLCFGRQQVWVYLWPHDLAQVGLNNMVKSWLGAGDERGREPGQSIPHPSGCYLSQPHPPLRHRSATEKIL